MDRPSVHVVIVNWNSGAQLRECLASFAAVAADDVALSRVTVVDNASSDGSCDALPDTLPLALIRNMRQSRLRGGLQSGGGGLAGGLSAIPQSGHAAAAGRPASARALSRSSTRPPGSSAFS